MQIRKEVQNLVDGYFKGTPNAQAILDVYLEMTLEKQRGGLNNREITHLIKTANAYKLAQPALAYDLLGKIAYLVEDYSTSAQYHIAAIEKSKNANAVCNFKIIPEDMRKTETNIVIAAKLYRQVSLLDETLKQKFQMGFADIIIKYNPINNVEFNYHYAVFSGHLPKFLKTNPTIDAIMLVLNDELLTPEEKEKVFSDKAITNIISKIIEEKKSNTEELISKLHDNTFEQQTNKENIQNLPLQIRQKNKS